MMFARGYLGAPVRLVPIFATQVNHHISKYLLVHELWVSVGS
jgi:hypothetical protein